MGTKKQNTDAMAAFLARGGKVKKCDPRQGNAIPLKRLNKAAEKAAEAGQKPNILSRRNGGLLDQSAAERAAKRERERYASEESRYERQAEEAAAMGGACVGFDEYGHAVSRYDY